MKQLAAGIRKDSAELFKTYRIYIFALGFLLFAVLDPVMILVLGKMLEMLQMEGLSQLPGMGIDITNQATGLASYVGDCVQLGVLTMLIAMMRAAGGDQKNRSCVIPLCTGMSRSKYIYSKFIVYSVTGAAVSMIGYLLAYGVSYLLYPTRVPFGAAMLSALAFMGFVLFIIAVALFLGCSTGKAGISVIVVFFASTFIPMILGVFDCNRFNPYALQNAAASPGAPLDHPSYWVSLGICLVSVPLLAFVTARIFQRKKLV